MLTKKTKIQNDQSIDSKRKTVAKQLMGTSSNINSENIKQMSNVDLEILYNLYERLFLDNWFEKNFKGKFEFSLSRRLSKSAGITRCPKNIFHLKPEMVIIQIAIGIDFFFRYDHIEGSKAVCGIETNNTLEALQIVFEHELCHAMEFITYGNSNCQGNRFKEISYQLFGHTESYHQMPTNREIASKKLGIHIGDNVSFIYENNKILGFVSNINKRATVMVKNKNGIFVDAKGIRYQKYYVPISSLEKTNEK